MLHLRVMKIFTLLLLIGMLLPSAIGFWWIDLEPGKPLSVDNHTLDSGSDHQSGGDPHSDQQNSDAKSRDHHYSHHQHGIDHRKGDEHHNHHGRDHRKGDEHHNHHGSDHRKGDEHHNHHGSDHRKGDEHHNHHGSDHMKGSEHHSHHHGGDHMKGGEHHSHHHGGDHRKGGEHHSHHKSGDRVPSSDKNHHSHHHGSDRNCSDHQRNHHHDGASASGAAEPHTPAAADPLTAAAEPHIPALELVHNTTSDTLPCPMLYTRVGQRCLAFFTVARVPWSTAREFCQSIFGDLVTFADIHQYIEILEYLQTSGVDVDLWVGGRDGKNGWEWMDGTPMPRGTPYWAIKSAEGTHSFIYPSTSYSQAPYSFPASKYGQTSSCAAMLPKYFYYLSDEACRDLKSPVCALREGAQVVIARGSEDTYPGFFIPTQDAHTIVWERALPTTTAHTTTDMEGAPPNTTAHTNTATTQPASTSSPISKSEDGFDGSGVQPSSNKHHTFDDSSEEEEDDEEEEEEEEKEGEKGQNEGSGMMPDFLVDSETVHNIFMEI